MAAEPDAGPCPQHQPVQPRPARQPRLRLQTRELRDGDKHMHFADLPEWRRISPTGPTLRNCAKPGALALAGQIGTTERCDLSRGWSIAGVWAWRQLFRGVSGCRNDRSRCRMALTAAPGLLTCAGTGWG
jgi:hypothetical protein